MGKNARETYDALSVGNLLWLDPKKAVIVGLDSEDEGHRLLDPRVKQHAKYLKTEDGRRFIESIKRYGVIDPTTVVKEGERVIVVRGRKRTMGARIANDELVAAGEQPKRLPAIIVVGDVVGTAAIDNSYHTEETPYIKAKRAESFRAAGYPEEDIGIFLDASRGTLANWKRLLQCVPEAIKLLDKEQVAVSRLYELGDLPPEEQRDKLASLPQEESAPKRERSRALRNAVTGEKSGKWSQKQIRAFRDAISPTEAEPFGKDDVNFALAYGLCQVFLGEDETAKELAEYPDVQKAVRKVRRALAETEE